MPRQEEFKSGPFAVHAAAVFRLLRGVDEHYIGMAELAKNSYGAYLGQEEAVGKIGATEENRIIVFFFRDGNVRKRLKTTVSCLDFVGMDQATFEKWGNMWGDPDATPNAARGFSGHGTGGKAYFNNMFEGEAYLIGVKNGVKNIRGFRGTDPMQRLRHGSWVRNQPVQDPIRLLDTELQAISNVSISQLPTDALTMLRNSASFTLAVGEDPKDVQRGRIPSAPWLNKLRASGQMIGVLGSCKVYVFHNGELLPDADPLSLVWPEHMHQESFKIPVRLRDDATGRDIDTGADDTSVLTIFQSEKSLTLGGGKNNKKDFNKIIYRAEGGTLGETRMDQFTRHNLMSKLRGEVNLSSLTACVSETRLDLVSTPLSRAVDDWIKRRIDGYIDKFDTIEKVEVRKEDRQANVEMMETLNQWKNQFCDKLPGMGGTGSGTGGRRTMGPRINLPRREVRRIRIAADSTIAGVGISVPFTLQFFDENEERVAPVPFDWEITDTNVCGVVDNSNVLNTFTPGNSKVSAKMNNVVVSNEVSIEVLNIRHIMPLVSEIEVQQGERKLLRTKCVDHHEIEYEDPRLEWISGEKEIAEVGSQGYVTGITPGQTKIYAGDEQIPPKLIATITVTPTGGETHRHPQLYLSEDQKGPYEEPPTLRRREGPLVQRTQDVDYNVWWINKRSPYADFILKAYGIKDPMWRGYVLQCFMEMITRVTVEQRLESGEIETHEWSNTWGELMTDVHVSAGESGLFRELVHDGNLSLLGNGEDTE